jgi:hypothetical protein
MCVGYTKLVHGGMATMSLCCAYVTRYPLDLIARYRSMITGNYEIVGMRCDHSDWLSIVTREYLRCKSEMEV